MESIISKKESLSPDSFINEFYQYLNEIILITQNFHRRQIHVPTFTCFMQHNIGTKTGQETLRRLNYKIPCVTNTDEYILSNVLANEKEKTQQYIKVIPYHDHIMFFPGKQDWLNIRK